MAICDLYNTSHMASASADRRSAPHVSFFDRVIIHTRKVNCVVADTLSLPTCWPPR